MAKSFDHNLNRIVSKSAVLDVAEGHWGLNRHFEEPTATHIPILISGHIEGGSGRNERQFSIAIDDIHVDADYAVTRRQRINESFHFDLCADTLERLDSLAESTIESGLGYLATANYHGQGQVAVPSHWLRALVAAYRAQHPETALFYCHLSERTDADGEFVEVVVVSKDYWEQHKALEGEPLTKQLGGRIPSGGVETEAGVFVYRDVNTDGLRAELHDGGFRENDELGALAATD
ncbi:hypothetical protein OIU34_20455 [Pararhizobium sp. BT-229]|uniref:hypothetical protein n=1 Tax=Pararhizobium sp. BT-229 TaxID=2986923 RepID=UPI0021F758CF|nr:hypothetical protein [Pararhizobium sp. BT-229]MCV9964261.1 hypothetical protein [Pararhizobium sp. BT-229]